MKRLILFLFFLFATYPAHAQQATGNITSGAGCGATSGPGCVVLGLPTNVSSVSVAVGGNFSANLAVQQSADGGNTWTSAGAVITSGSTTNYTIKAQNQFRVCAAALCGGSYTSGTAFVSILYSTAASGGGGSGTVSGQTPNCIPKASAVSALTGCSSLSDDGTTVSTSEAVSTGTLRATVASLAASGCVQTIVLVCADQQAGADWSVKVNAAITALGSVAGTIDARGFTVAQNMSQSVTLPTNVVLFLPCVAITRSTGKQFIFTGANHARLLGCNNDGEASFATQILSGGSDTTAILTSSAAVVYGIEVGNFEIGVAGTGAIGLNILEPQHSTFHDLVIKTDIGEFTGVAGGCSCYNTYTNVIELGGSIGREWATVATSSAVQNTTNVGSSRGSSYGTILGTGAGSNLFLQPDDESDSNTAAFDILGSGNIIFNPYNEGSGPILFDTGSTGNWLLALNAAGGYSFASGTERAANFVQERNAISGLPTGNNSINGLTLGDKGSGGSDTLFGQYAGAGITTGQNIVAVGQNAAEAIVSNSSLTAVGNSALNSDTGGVATAVGRRALYALVSNQNATAVGDSALTNATGGGSTALGDTACGNVTSGTNDVCVGFNSEPSAAGDSNEIAIGEAVTGAGANTATVGNSSTTDTYFGSSTPNSNIHGKGYYSGATAGITDAGLCSATFGSTLGLVTTCTAASDPRLKVYRSYTHGLDAIMRLQPIHFHWNAIGLKANGLSPASPNSEQVGFSAANVKQIMPEAVGIESHDGVDYLSLPQGDRPIVAALVNAVKEQQLQIEKLQKEVSRLITVKPRKRLE